MGKAPPGAESGAGLEEGMAGAGKEEGKRPVDKDGVCGAQAGGGPDAAGRNCFFQEGIQGVHKSLGIQDKAPSDPVVGTLGNAEVFAEGRDAGELPCDPCVKEGKEESKAERGERNDHGQEEGMGMAAGRA